MAPVKPKGASRLARKSATAKPSKPQKVGKRPPPKQVKTKPVSATVTSKPKKKATPVYTDAQLNLPAMNSIIPASATAAQRSGKGTGKKKNKVYVDDQESMMTILALVNAEKEGAIESKMMRERQMEEIREARRKETEKRAEQKKGKFEEVKRALKSKSKHPKNEDAKTVPEKPKGKDGERKKRKSVSFA